MTDELIGKTIGGYEIISHIGRGGMATVFCARQTSMNRVVALKVLPRDMMKDDSYLQRFEREVSIVATLEHRNIVPVYDHGSYEGQPYIAMRYMKGGSLDGMITGKGMPLDQIVRVFSQIAPALDYAHSNNILHRDLKPSNVLLDDDGGAYITDFGIARILNEAPGMTITTQGVVGTPAYMSPEQAQGQPLDGRSDVYSLGVMLFEMATGRRPFHSDTPYSIAVMQVTAPVPSPRSINPSLPIAVEQVIYRSLKKKPEERYQTAQDFAEALKMAVEKPGYSLHDTQPNPINVRKMLEERNLEMTQPSAAQQPTSPPPVAPVSPPQPIQYLQSAPQPIYAPMNPVTPRTPAGSGAMNPVMARPRRRPKPRGANVWISMAIGAMIGCALLALVVIALVFVVDSFFGGASNTSSMVNTPTANPRTNAPAVVPDSSPEAENTSIMTPSPLRTQTTVNRSATDALSNGRVLYFSERTDSEGRLKFNIFRRELSMEEELQLTSDGSNNANPSPSPDGQFFTFQSDRRGNYDIYVANMAGGERTRVTNGEYDEVMPAWSPDGDWIAYAADVRNDGTMDILRVRRDGSDMETLVSNGRRNSAPRWDSKGERLVFVSGTPRDSSTWNISMLTLSSGEVTAITANSVREAWPVFSPDDQYITYVYGNEGDTSIRRVSINGDDGEPEELHARGDFIWDLNYTPDQKYIVFNAGESDQAASDVYAIPANGGDDRQRIAVNRSIGLVWVP